MAEAELQVRSGPVTEPSHEPSHGLSTEPRHGLRQGLYTEPGAAGPSTGEDAEAQALRIRYLSTDSRQSGLGPETLFIAIRGAGRDGTQFIRDAWARGVRCFMCAQAPELPAGAIFLIHPDPLRGLQSLAAAHRRQFEYPVLAITGSNGKTIVKEWLSSLLGSHKLVVRNPRSYNSQIGVPLSLWAMRSWHELGVFEAGISLPAEMERLERMIQPRIGLMLNIGPPHDQGFGSREEKLEEKLKLFEHCESILYCADHIDIQKALTRRFPHKKLFSWSLQGRNADVQGHLNQDMLSVEYSEQSFSCRLPFDDPFCAENLLQAVTAALFLGMEAEQLPARIAQLSQPELRMKVQQAQGGGVLINDAYSSDLGSLEPALTFAARQGAPGMQRIALLSDIEQSGLPESERYARLGQWLLGNAYSRLLAVGPEMSRANFPKDLQVQRFEDTASLIRALPVLNLEGHLILIKGARRFKLEQVADMLVEKVHGTRLEIDLEALAHNLALYRSHIGPGVRIMVMVKALGYGSGDAEIARVLAYGRADYLGVAYADEGVSLRQAGISLPIVVLNAAVESFRVMERFRLEPEIYSLELLDLVRTAFPHMAIHLKLDTGMHRLGLNENDVTTLIEQPERLRGLRLASVFSHLAASEDPANDAFSRDQIARFKEWAGSLKALWCAMHPQWDAPLLHMSNSAGMLRFPEAALDMVRLGIGLYGHDPSGILSPQLRAVSRLMSTVVQIAEHRAGECIGYGRAGLLERDTRVATLSIGYADGFRRSLGKGVGRVAAQGQLLPVIGQVCMDMCMVDATAVPALRVGDSVEIYGDQISLEELARCLNTIPYEVLTGVSSRVKRVYLA